MVAFERPGVSLTRFVATRNGIKQVTRRRTNRQPERALHTHVGKMLKWLKPKCVFFPVPNATTDLGRKTGGILKGQEKIYPGVSDWIFMWGDDYNDDYRCTCGAIELKVPPNGQSDDQKIFENDCKLRGIPYRIATSVDDVVAILVEWGRLPAGTVDRMRGRMMAFEFKCVKMRETKHAVLVVDKETGEDVWMPLSQIYSMHFDDGGDGYMMISDWIAGEKGLG